MRLRIRAWLRRRRINKILKDSGCRSWYEYWMVNDPDMNINGKSVQECYVGYASIIEVPYSLVMRQPSFDQGFVSDGTYEFREWCKQNCEGKFRVHWHRTRKDGTFDHFDGDGGEAVYAVFKNETDAARFVLMWM